MRSTLRFWSTSLTLLAAIAGLHLLPHGRPIPLARPLANLPFAFSQWHGVEAPFDQSVVKALAVDDYVNRVYRGEDREPIGLYVAYYESQQTAERLHSPQNCLPGTGWQPLTSSYMWLKNPDGRAVLVNRYVVEKGVERQLVLYWYQSHGRTIASEYRARIDMVIDAISLHRTDAALVRINTPMIGSGTENRAVQFGVAILRQLDGFIPK